MEKEQLNILELGEVRWKEEVDYISNDILMIYADEKESQR